MTDPVSLTVKLGPRVVATASFAAPEIKLGWIGGGGMSTLLAHSAGPSNAAMMLPAGDPIDAHTAMRWGLVSQVVAPDALLSTATDLAARRMSRIFATSFASVYPHYVTNAERKGRTNAEVDQVIQ